MFDTGAISMNVGRDASGLPDISRTFPQINIPYNTGLMAGNNVSGEPKFQQLSSCALSGMSRHAGPNRQFGLRAAADGSLPTTNTTVGTIPMHQIPPRTVAIGGDHNTSAGTLPVHQNPPRTATGADVNTQQTCPVEGVRQGDNKVQIEHTSTAYSSVIPTIYDQSRYDQLVQEENEFEEEVDEEFSDEEMEFGDDDAENGEPKYDDVTQKLLKFAEMVNADIQKFFGNRKDEDSCDIYEDKWTSGKSGRELYYADILRIAQGRDVDEPESPKKKDQDHNGKTYTGKMDKKIGLGPLADLFDIGVKGNERVKERKGSNKKSAKRLKHVDVKKYDNIMPMQQRNLPQSFWAEPKPQPPKTLSDCNTTSRQSRGRSERENCGEDVSLAGSAPAPDFSDLLDSWAGEHLSQSSDTNSA